jgi:hypothetical protein
MEMLAIIASCGSLILAGANAMIFCIVKFNDLKHQEESLKRIEENQKTLIKLAGVNGERIAKIEGKCTANHG